jgi:hypothetical protein
MPDLRMTVAAPDRAECLRALHAAVELYRQLRDDAQLHVVRRTDGTERLRRLPRLPAGLKTKKETRGHFHAARPGGRTVWVRRTDLTTRGSGDWRETG